MRCVWVLSDYTLDEMQAVRTIAVPWDDLSSFVFAKDAHITPKAREAALRITGDCCCPHKLSLISKHVKIHTTFGVVKKFIKTERRPPSKGIITFNTLLVFSYASWNVMFPSCSFTSEEMTLFIR